MPSQAVDRPTGPATIWIVLRYVSALAAALPLGAAAALAFCVWNWNAGPQDDPRSPGSAWILLLALLGSAGLTPALWAAWTLQNQARAHGRIAVVVSSVLALLVAGLLVCLVFAIASVTAAIALP